MQIQVLILPLHIFMCFPDNKYIVCQLHSLNNLPNQVQKVNVKNAKLQSIATDAGTDGKLWYTLI